jgi:hypothetical protein
VKGLSPTTSQHENHAVHATHEPHATQTMHAPQHATTPAAGHEGAPSPEHAHAKTGDSTAASSSHTIAAKKSGSTHGSHAHDEHADFASHLLKALTPTAHVAAGVPLPSVPHMASASGSGASTSTHAKRAQAQAQASHKPGAKSDELESVAAAAAAAPPSASALDGAHHSPSTESSTRTVATFSPEASTDLPKASDVPMPHVLPSWMPADAVMDDTARMAIFPHALNWTSEAGNGSLQMQVRNGEVTVRAQGQLGVALRNSESELRVALAQKGLELHDSEAPSTDNHDRGQQQSQQQNQNQNQEQDEWT